MPVKVKAKVKAEDNKLQAMLDKMQGLRKAQLELRERHKDAFTAYEKLQDEYETLESMLKDSVRTSSVPGHMVCAVSSNEVSVFVCGRMKPVEYDMEAARKMWGSALLKEVLVVDAGKVEVLVGKNMITEASKLAAMRPREAATPAVTIKWNGALAWKK
jgi:hypothetical protein